MAGGLNLISLASLLRDEGTGSLLIVLLLRLLPLLVFEVGFSGLMDLCPESRAFLIEVAGFVAVAAGSNSRLL